MKLHALLSAALGSILAVDAVAAPAPVPAPDVCSSLNHFAIDLYGQTRIAKGNVCISPYSVGMALGMVAGGAADTTATQILSTLHWSGSPNELAKGLNLLTTAIEERSDSDPSHPQSLVDIANALFGQQGYPFRKEFLDLLNQQYKAPLQQVDFSSSAASAADQVNQWAATKTKDRIKQAVNPSEIDSSTRLLLVDAVYFKANWEEAFSKSATQDKPFFTDGHATVHVPTMQVTRSFGYSENDSVQIASLPYMGGFEMDILLPRDKAGIDALEKSLVGKQLDDLLNSLSPHLLELSLPRFTMQGSYQLRSTLENLGMRDAFDPAAANFSGIVTGQKLSIDRVIQKTFISVDEEGTEAAAVTSITMRALAMRQREVPQKAIFLADHPFLYIIRHQSTGAILFIGRMSDPK